ncbi:Uncharacterised protein [Mycobacterium tuberculosis]|uniref:Uncharacterized protein n=2 Tax=Mycobacterium tuberculosis TaxID=1773 RepID=A0A655JAY5_MYCTX|nr:Uncharacterised protein [Mycobacterium tuberculosis]COW65112.1 Uncharacterised protein [Mycobacterium tuberculosis]COX41250.1 Uncharacterised protein [Mycobacterium tuberculosis]
MASVAKSRRAAGESVTGAASTSTTSPTRTRSTKALSARCSGTMRASGPAVDSANRLPSKRTSVSTSPRRVGLASVEPTTASRSACDPSGSVVAERFSSLTSPGVNAVPGRRSCAATTTSARSSSGLDRSAATPASMTSPAAAKRRARTVRVQSGRKNADIRLTRLGFREDSATPQTVGAAPC